MPRRTGPIAPASTAPGSTPTETSRLSQSLVQYQPVQRHPPPGVSAVRRRISRTNRSKPFVIGTQTLPRQFNWRLFFQKYGLVLSLLLLCLALSLALDRFLTGDNLPNVLRQSSINIISIGMMMVILTRGSTCQWARSWRCRRSSADMLKNEGMPVLQATGSCLLVGAAAGAVTGFLVSWVNIPPFIATLGMMTCRARPSSTPTASRSPAWTAWARVPLPGTAEIGPIPLPIIVAGGLRRLCAAQSHAVWPVYLRPGQQRGGGIPLRPAGPPHQVFSTRRQGRSRRWPESSWWAGSTRPSRPRANVRVDAIVAVVVAAPVSTAAKAPSWAPDRRPDYRDHQQRAEPARYLGVLPGHHQGRRDRAALLLHRAIR